MSPSSLFLVSLSSPQGAKRAANRHKFGKSSAHLSPLERQPARHTQFGSILLNLAPRHSIWPDKRQATNDNPLKTHSQTCPLAWDCLSLSRKQTQRRPHTGRTQTSRRPQWSPKARRAKGQRCACFSPIWNLQSGRPIADCVWRRSGLCFGFGLGLLACLPAGLLGAQVGAAKGWLLEIELAADGNQVEGPGWPLGRRNGRGEMGNGNSLSTVRRSTFHVRRSMFDARCSMGVLLVSFACWASFLSSRSGWSVAVAPLCV